MWAYLAVLSAILLGLYDVSRKHALRENAVLPVLFASTLAGLATTFPILILSQVSPETVSALAGGAFAIEPLEWRGHGLVFLKAVIVSASWVCGYFAMKHLPISIVSPIRASAPVWTLFGAILIFGEELNWLQWLGLLGIFAAYYSFALLGLKEGIHFLRNRWIWCIAAATLIGSGSALYDKYLLKTLGLSPMTVQAWFAVYLVLVLAVVVAACWYPRRKEYTPFRFRYSIVLVGVLLVLSDFVYFTALSQPGALLSLISAIRRSNAVLSFALGAVAFGEVNKLQKGLALAGVLASVFLILYASR